MKIEQINVLSGPNFWSISRKKLIAMRIDLEELEQRPTNKIPGFLTRLKSLLPTLYSHRCSRGKVGGFLERVKEGTWMGHVIEHIALEIQSLAGMPTAFGRTRKAGKPGVYNVVFAYQEPKAGRYAAVAAVRIAEALIKGEPYDLAKDIAELKKYGDSERLGPSTYSIVREAEKRGIPFIRLDDNALVQLGYGKNQKRIEATIASTTSCIAVELAGDKSATKKVLDAAEVPVPKGAVVYSLEELKNEIEDIGFPVVVKPRDGNQGKGATTNINSWEEAAVAFEAAQHYSRAVICERFIQGDDYRALVVNYKFVAAARRKPAAVVGDGKHTIAQLVEMVNKDPRRGNGHENVMTKIKLDDATLQLLEKKGYTTDTVLAKGEECYLKTTANLSTGGTATDVTDQVHPKNVSLFNRIARVIGLDICGIDIMATDLSRPITENGGAVIEVNAAPGFRMHLQPSEGKARNVAAPVIDMLFPKGTEATIPIIAVTGTNGKTTTTRLLAHMCQQEGFTTGYTTTEGIYIQGEKLVEGDCSGPRSAQFILKDPSVEMAVLECARGGMLRNGLAFDECDVAVITNVAEDHLGLNGIDTLEKLAKVKAVVADTVKEEGYAILNADDDLVYAMAEDLSCKVAFFSLDENNPRIKQHCRKGGLAAVNSGGYITLIDGKNKIKVERASRIPITFDGKADFNIANVLGAVLACYARNFSIESIRQSLTTFVPSAEQTPGRMNMFEYSNFTLMIDYAHNPHGIRAVGKYIQSVKATKKIGVIAGVGDRRDEDLVALGQEAAKIFDEIVVRMDDDLRGRTKDEIFELIAAGVKSVTKNKKMTMIADEQMSLRTAIVNAEKGYFIAFFTDKIFKAIEIANEYLQQEKSIKRKPAKLTPMQRFPFLKNVAM
ncbi:cyanophycin synthetase [Aridibaculum aurantiacum]|uniref:cyanophycin synthetase n=1 Tax=Aridibaculum aurantiacum TaxID=2810307 RepID=UPI001A9620CA|nr:cyanophycin synthetase [Aridibaculum aurantiacum]